MKLEEMDEILIAKAKKEEANRALAQRWLGNHMTGEAIDKGWSYPCKNNCHSHCQTVNTCTCPCHDDGMGHC